MVLASPSEPLSQLEVLVVDCQATALGPFASAVTLEQFGALARAERTALTSGSRGPDDRTFTAGYDRLCATHPELSRVDLSDYAKLLRLATRLWREGRRDRDVDEDDANDTRRNKQRM